MKQHDNFRAKVYEIGGPAAMSNYLQEFTREKVRIYNWLREDTIPRKYILAIKKFDEKYETNFIQFITPPSLKEQGVQSPFSKFVGNNSSVFLSQVNSAIKKVNEKLPEKERHPLWTGAQLYQYVLRGYAPYGFKNLFAMIPELNERMTDDIFEKPSVKTTDADDLLG